MDEDIGLIWSKMEIGGLRSSHITMIHNDVDQNYSIIPPLQSIRGVASMGRVVRKDD